MERFENGSDMCGFRSCINIASKRGLNLLDVIKLIVWKVVIERITVVNFRIDNPMDRFSKVHEYDGSNT